MAAKRLPVFPPPSFARRARAREKGTSGEPQPVSPPDASNAVCPTCRKRLEWTDRTGDRVLYRCVNVDCPTLIVYVVLA